MAVLRAIKTCLTLLALTFTLTGVLTPAARAQTHANAHDSGVTPEAATDLAPPSVVDPTLRILERVSQRTAPQRGLFAPSDSFDAERVEVSLRFDSSIDAPARARLERLGVRVRSGTFAEDGLCRASVPWHALDAVARLPGLVRVEALWQAHIDSPLEETNKLIHATQARLHPPEAIHGRGVRIGLIDTGIDVLHPAFFRPDAGHFSWIDVDGDARFTPGHDAVDLNHDGDVDRNEVLRVLDATVIVDFEGGEVRNADAVFDTHRDWVYADMNGDGARNAGTTAGFSESTPALGEALFVADDVDHNGTLDIGEKLVRLGTSKIARYQTREQTFVRGENLIDAVSESADAFHGTGVGGILVGGQPPYHERVGVAPGADLYVYGLSATLQRDNALPLGFLEAAVADGVDLLLHEWTNSFTQPMDGSTNFEAAMGTSRDAGVVHINPVGNLNRSEKHRIAAAEPGSPTTLKFVVGEGFDGPSGALEYTAAFGSLQWTESHPGLAVEVTAPGGENYRWRVDESASVDVAGATLEMAFAETTRGSGYLEFYLEASDSAEPLATGEWTLELTGFSRQDEVWARVTDEYSNWRPGIRWSAPTSGRGTIAFPATADAGFGVGAYAGRGATDAAATAADHELRAFSGHGPRLDGEPVVQLTAPDDPYVPLAATPEILDAGWGRSWFTAFAGTSGAAPHVAGTVALMKAHAPGLTPADVEQALVETALSDDLVPEPAQLPGRGWGYGRLDAYAAIFGEPAPQLEERPSAYLDVVEGDTTLTLDASAGETAGQLEYRFDVDYDGVWDTEWNESSRTTIAIAEVTQDPLWSRVEVRNAVGQHSGAIAKWSPRQTGGDAGGMYDASTVDTGGDTGTDPPRGDCCSQTRGSAPVHWSWLALLGVVAIVRRTCRRAAL